MAEPIDFEQSNRSWYGYGDTGDLPVYQEGDQSISCWQLTEDELKEISQTGMIWLRVWAGNHPAVYVGGENPWGEWRGE